MPDGDGSSVYPPGLQLNPWNPDEHTPFVCLINPKSGGRKGAPILDICLRTPVYQDRCFGIVEVNKGGAEMDKFRQRLNEAKAHAKGKKSSQFRPRLICGGGDGTASFALLVVFKALLADNTVENRKDAGNGFIWTDQEMEHFFPALVQMPLGTGNDLGGILGWGRKYPGHTHTLFCKQSTRGSNLVRWFDTALRITTPVVNFDVWGFMPPPGREEMNMKVAELARVGRSEAGAKEYVMKTADAVVPFLVLLYSSYGFSANVVARFQLVRHSSQLLNLVEYAKISRSLLIGSKCSQLRRNMEGMSITTLPDDVPEKNGTHNYFPPRSTRPSMKYREVGFLNINSYSGGTLHGEDRAACTQRWFLCGKGRQGVRFGDGKADFYRQSVLRTAAKTGSKLQTDKKRGGTFHFEAAKGRGIFLQYDGEGRFVFHPQGDPWRMDVQQVLTIPMVVAPGYAPPGHADDEPARFRITGTPADVERVKARILKWVHGKLVPELNATEEDIRAAGLPIEPREDDDTNKMPTVVEPVDMGPPDDGETMAPPEKSMSTLAAEGPAEEESPLGGKLLRPVKQTVDSNSGVLTTSL